MALGSGQSGVSKTPTVIGTLEEKTRHISVVALEEPESNLLSSQSRNVFTCTGGFPGQCSPRLLCDKITFILKSWRKTSPRLLSELFIYLPLYPLFDSLSMSSLPLSLFSLYTYTKT